MSQLAIRAALETALNSMSPALSTAWENVAFTPPVSSTPYQRAYVMFATPDNSVIGNEWIERGLFQVTLCYPLQAGDAAARARVALLRAEFYRGRTLTSGGTTVIIERTPDAGGGTADGDRWIVPVRVRWFSQGD